MDFKHQDWNIIYTKANKEINKKPEDKKKEIDKIKFSKENKMEKQIEDGNLKHKKMDANFGKELQQKRLSKGMTQKDLANKLNIPSKIINEIESGNAKHNPQLIIKINRIFR